MAATLELVGSVTGFDAISRELASIGRDAQKLSGEISASGQAMSRSFQGSTQHARQFSRQAGQALDAIEKEVVQLERSIVGMARQADVGFRTTARTVSASALEIARMAGTAVSSVARQSLAAVQTMASGAATAVSRSLAVMRAATRPVITAFSQFSAALSGAAALASLAARNNEELSKKLEVATFALFGASYAARALGAAIRFALTPIGLIVTAIGTAIAVFLHWEAVQRTVSAAVQKAWKPVGEFFGNLFSAIGEMGIGLGKILLGGLTGNVKLAAEGLAQVRKGIADVGAISIQAGEDLVTSFKDAAKAAWDFVGGLTAAKKEIQAIGLTPTERRLAALGEAFGGVTDDVIAKSQALGAALSEAGRLGIDIDFSQARTQNLDQFLANVRDQIKSGMAELSRIHGGDLVEFEGMQAAMGDLAQQRIAEQIAAEQARVARVASLYQSDLVEFEGVETAKLDAAKRRQKDQEDAERRRIEALTAAGAAEVAAWHGVSEAVNSGINSTTENAIRSYASLSDGLKNVLNISLVDWANYSAQTQVFIQSIGEAASATWQTFTSGVGQAFAATIVYGQSLSDSLKSMVASVASTIIQMLVQVAAQAIITAATQKTAAVSAATVEVGAAAVTGGAWTWAAAVKEYGIVGVVIGAVLAAVVIAGIMALLNSITGSAAGGLEKVPETGTFLLHRGEAVLQRDQNRDLRRFLDDADQEKRRPRKRDRDMPRAPETTRSVTVNINAEVIEDDITRERFMRRLRKDLGR